MEALVLFLFLLLVLAVEKVGGMKTRTRRRTRTIPSSLLCLWAAGLFLFLAGSKLGAAPTSPRFTVDPPWTTDEGLPENTVIALTQTRDGYLWLGTLKGLVRFDGVGHVVGGGRRQFPVFDPANTPGLGSAQIVKLFEDSRSNLWIGTEDAGVALAREGSLTPVELEHGGQPGRLTTICEDSSGAVWLLTDSQRLYR